MKRLLRIAEIMYSEDETPREESKREKRDLRLDDIERRVGDALDGVKDAMALLGEIGLDPGEAMEKIISHLKKELESGDACVVVMRDDASE